MNLEPRAAAKSPFIAADLLLTSGGPSEPSSRVPWREPKFLTPPNFFRFRWSELLGDFFTVYPQHLVSVSGSLFRQIPLLPRRFAGKPFIVSLMVHLFTIPLLTCLLQRLSNSDPRDNTLPLGQQAVVYYHLSKPQPLKQFSNFLPNGAGSIPGEGDLPEQISIKGASKALGSIFILSRPYVPDNHRQTILQPASPPDLRIKNDLKLPNLISEQASVPKPRFQDNASEVRPLRPTEHQTKEDAPALTKTTSAELMNGILVTTNAHPHLAVPFGGAMAPHMPSRRTADAAAASAPLIVGSENGEQGLLILGMEPSPASETFAVLDGNRYGQFASALGTSGAGSLGGVEVTSVDGGIAGNGEAGAEGPGMGKGRTGAGGGEIKGTSGFIGLKDGNKGELGLSDRGPNAVAQLVFAMPLVPHLRHNSLVVSAGPLGGGGSNVYGALPCRKIYTVFLPTTGKQWSLQYCQKVQAPSRIEDQARTTVVHTELPIIPPEPEEKFDFKRSPVTAEKTQKSIVLRGAIDEDGKVEQVEVYQGLSAVMDSAARLAFSQWKFKPAMRDGKPIRVEILVAIPTEQTYQ